MGLYQTTWPTKKTNIPWEAYNKEGNITHDSDEILSIWKNDFRSLYNPATVTQHAEQVHFKNQIITENHHFEQLPCDDNSPLNRPLSNEEISKTVFASKNNKAPGIDGIVYEVLKNEISVSLLTRLFNLCYTSHRIPDIWTQALISPIPKCPQNDPRVPLNYRGISLLSVLSKLYTSALNVRLNAYNEENGIIVNEQNGFRQKRSCLDHIFVLQDTLRIRNQLNSQTFCAFIDFKKAFDLVDRDALLYKLRKIGVKGHFYHAVKALYENAKLCKSQR